MMHKLQSSSVLYPFTLQCHWEFRYSAHTHTHTHTHDMTKQHQLFHLPSRQLMVESSRISSAEGLEPHQHCWTHQRQISFMLDKSFPQGAPNPLSHISCLDCRTFSGARGTNRRRGGYSKSARAVQWYGCGVSRGYCFTTQGDKSFESTLHTGHLDVSGNEWPLFSFLFFLFFFRRLT